jgi:hypothetical protein
MMAGMEVVVRPVVFPNIRPASARSLPLADDPHKGFAVIRGNGGKQIDLTNSFSSSTSSSSRNETQRRVDKARVYQKNDDGTVNKENFIDIEVANKIWMEGGSEPVAAQPQPWAPPSENDAGNVTRRPTVEIEYYRPIQEADNIEIKKRNFIKRSGEEIGPI